MNAVDHMNRAIDGVEPQPQTLSNGDILKIIAEELSAITGMSRQQRRKLERDLRKQRSRP